MFKLQIEPTFSTFWKISIIYAEDCSTGYFNESIANYTIKL